MKKILFLIHDLGPGGAEKVLVNLVNNLDPSKFAVTVMTLFDVGVNRKYLKNHVRYLSCFRKMVRGNSHLMKLFSPEQLHRILIKDHYDIEVSYLEGPCARIISGCPWKDTKLVSWIHTEFSNQSRAAESFRNIEEAEKCYNAFHKIVCVSESVKKAFLSTVRINIPVCVLYNTSEYDKIIHLSHEKDDCNLFAGQVFKMIAVGKLQPGKGFERLLKTAVRLKKEKYDFHLYILGTGPEEAELKKYSRDHGLSGNVDFLGYKENPYKYFARCDLFVCASYREGFSTAATEALITGTAVCTVDVGGMREMLGENNEYGMVTENDDISLLNGIKRFMEDKNLLNYYRAKASERGQMFSTDKTVEAVENMLLDL